MQILVGIDEREDSRLAVAEAAELAHALGANLYVVLVRSTVSLRALSPGIEGGAPPVVRFPADADAASIRKAAEAIASAKGVPFEFLDVQGEPAVELLRMAAAVRADLLVVGAGTRSVAARLLLGSVSDRVAREAPCSVLIARGRKLELPAPSGGGDTRDPEGGAGGDMPA
jgi:nucleotide-binding universal stress UspA family protein